MKPTLSLLLACAALVPAIPARANSWPDACGGEKIKFDVSTEKDRPAPTPPSAGKAQIVFVENENQMIGPFMHATVRFGMDGAWVGADKGSSYFALTVDPGEHHLCASWQGVGQGKDVDLVPLTAEPGKVYYFEAKVTVESKHEIDFGLSQLNEDEAKYRLKASALSTGTTKK